LGGILRVGEKKEVGIMKQKILTLQIALLCMLMPVFAQPSVPSDVRDTNRNRRAASAIFNDIMQTLPNAMKVKVDSAGMSRKTECPVAASKGHGPANSRASGPASSVRRDGAVKNLPVDVRGQVEKAIADIDLMNQNRQIQFKEYGKKHPGSR
jgi:hypothetical protein